MGIQRGGQERCLPRKDVWQEMRSSIATYFQRITLVMNSLCLLKRMGFIDLKILSVTHCDELRNAGAGEAEWLCTLKMRKS